MKKMNYITHLNAVFEQFTKDSRLNPTHVSVYMALFQLWNHLHFPETFHVNREDIMGISKVGSKSTYHRVVKELSHWKYLVYFPSHNPFKGSKIKMLIFGTTYEQVEEQLSPKIDTTSGQVVEQHSPKIKTSYGQALVPKYKLIKTNKNNINLAKGQKPKYENEVLEFFKKQKSSEIDAQKFHNHYQAVGWKLGGKTEIKDWKALAKKWILKSKEFEAEKQSRVNSQQQPQNQDKLESKDYLHTNRDKNYHQPL